MVAVLGPTASGKSEVAIQVAEHLGGQVVSVDSMQVYRGMDIGTAKATAEMRRRCPHHLLDLCEPSHDMSVAEFQQFGKAVIDDLTQSGVIPVICGGSGLHFRSLVDPLEFPPRDSAIRAELEALASGEARARLLSIDPAATDHVDMANPRRVVRALEIATITGLVPSARARSEEAIAVREYQSRVELVAVGLDPGVGIATRIEKRFDIMLADGLLGEVARLQPRLGTFAAQAVGYKELAAVVAGEVELETGRLAAIRATRGLAKRQRTFFRRDPRIRWLPWAATSAERVDAAISYIDGQLP